MYPHTEISIDDRSDIPAFGSVTDTTDRPVFMCGFTSDKGPEEFTEKIGDSWAKSYGIPNKNSFDKHGQPYVQAARIAESGGIVYGKRIVAPDSKLANVGVVANLKFTDVQKVDEDGELLFFEADGVTETLTKTANRVMIKKATIKYELKTITGTSNNFKNLSKNFYDLNKHTGAPGVDDKFALFMLADVGRGVSGKRFKIIADTNMIKAVDYIKYIIDVIEDNQVIESLGFTVNPDVIENNRSITLSSVVQEYSSQIRAQEFEVEIDAFITSICTATGIDPDDYKSGDILFGRNYNDVAYPEVEIDPTSDSLNSLSGISLVGGDNGSFGSHPVKSTDYEDELVKMFTGKSDVAIYNFNDRKIDVIFDCNYPAKVKDVIERFVNFREDIFFFRDMGIVKSIDEIKLALSKVGKSRFAALYHNSWDVINPYSKRQMTVTCTYSLATLFIKHYLNGRARPFVGIKYGITFPDVIKGTVNFLPIITPDVNNSATLDTIRVNYANYYNGLLVMETQYTSQARNTQLSNIHNVLAIHELIKDIRAHCPHVRYSFLDSSDFDAYADDMRAVINKSSHNFASVNVKFMGGTDNATMLANKIFYGVIEVSFRNFVQTERFKIVALQTAG